MARHFRTESANGAVCGLAILAPTARHIRTESANGANCEFANSREIARCFHTLILKDIPQLGPEKRNEAKRFVTFIDALYEARVNFICSAAVPPETLYPEGDGAFEFERTVSRLMEMQSVDYMAMSHAG